MAAVVNSKQPPASPSSPSARFTAFDEATNTNVASGTNASPIGRLTPIKGIRETKCLCHTDIALCQKRADNISARPRRPRADYSP